MPRLAAGRRLSVGVLLALGTLSGAALAGEEALTHYVPADVGLYVELRNGADLLLPLTDSQAWLTLAEFAGQPARLEEIKQWRRRVEHTVKMSPAEAIQKLFSQRVAFVGQGLRRSQDTVVVCRPVEDPRALVRAWQARPFPTASRTSVYRLPYHVGLVLHDDLLVFGDDSVPGMFASVLRLLESDSPPALADDPLYSGLLARVPPDPDGVFFARLAGAAPTSAPVATQPVATTQPAALPLPGVLRGSANILLALHRRGDLLHFTAVGDAPAPPARTGPDATGLAALLPERTLLVWADAVDYANAAQAVQTLPERNALRAAYELQERTGTIQRLTAALDTATCVAVGVVTPRLRRVPAPPVPAVAVLIHTRDAAAVRAEWQTLLHSTVAVYKLMSLKMANPRGPLALEQIDVDGVPVERLDLSQLVGLPPEQTPLGELELCWTVQDDVLIIASHTDWLRQILAARRGQAPTLAGILDQIHTAPAGRREALLFAHTGPVADLGTLWLEYLRRMVPGVLDERWWRAYQPGGRDVQLGIQVTANAEHRRLFVQSVTAGTPADGILEPGDEIIGCNRRRFTTSQPVEEIRRGLLTRPDARWIDLLVERGGGLPRVKRVPLEFVDPVQVLRRVISIGHLFQRVVYSDDAPENVAPRGYLTLELRAGKGPLFDFPDVADPPEEAPK